MRFTASGSSRWLSQAKLNRAKGVGWPSKAYRRPVYHAPGFDPTQVLACAVPTARVGRLAVSVLKAE